MADFQHAHALAVCFREERSVTGVLARAFLTLYLDESPSPLTPRQAAIVRFIADYIDEQGYPPSQSEISQRFDYRSTATAHEHLKNLETKGWIRLDYNMPRGIRLLRRVQIQDPSEAAKYAVSDPNIMPDVTL